MSREIVSCEHSIRKISGNRTLKLNCRRCEDKYSLEDCLPNILLALKDKYDIDSIMISDHMEKHYIGPGVNILTQIRDIADEMENFSSRTQDQKKCSTCELQPSSLYPDLKKRFIKDPGTIYQEIQKLAAKTKQKQDCPECMKSLREELEILGESAISLRSHVLEEGFDIVG